MEPEFLNSLHMTPALSKAQRKAAAMALEAKKNKKQHKQKVSALFGAAKQMYRSMTAKQLEEFATTPEKNLPQKVRK